MADDNNADSSTALDLAQDKALAAGDVAAYNAIENAREQAEKTGKATPEAPPPSSEIAAASETATTTTQEKKPKTGEDRKAELHAEIQELLKKRAELQGKTEPPAEKKPADPAPAAVEPPKPPAGPKAPVEPQLADFTTFAEYQAADRKYTRELVVFETQAAIAADRATQATQAANKTIEESWTKRVREAEALHDDFAAVAFSPTTPITPAMDGFILKCPIGPQVLYRLGENASAEGKRIAALDPFDTVEALAEIRNELSGKVTAPPARKHTAAPPPATDLGARNTDAADPVQAALNRGDVAAYMRLANARDAKARAA